MADRREQLLFFIFVGFVLFNYVSAALIGKLQNTEAVVGSRVEFFCTTSEPYSINWKHTPVGEQISNDIFYESTIIRPYDNDDDRLEVKVNQTTGEYRLIFENVHRKDAGRYECIDEAGQGDIQAAELVVLESTPQCRENFTDEGIVIDNDCGMDPESIEIKCDLRYAGNEEPKLRWYYTGGSEVIPRNAATRSLPGHSIVSVSIKPILQADGGSYTCQTSWSNISWTSSTAKLLYAFSNLSIQTIRKPIQLNCTANSSQHCTHQRWIHNDELIPHRMLEINSPGLYTCLARCRLRDRECDVITKEVEFVAEESVVGHFATQPIGIIVGATVGATTVVIIVVAILVAAVVYRIKCVRKRNSLNENGRLNSSSHNPSAKSPPRNYKALSTTEPTNIL